ncbi:tyrosine-type recombinase/integrase [Alterisphingorhabdus coralli]|uniref:Tyrosine-type recombinase/integrase n=1 Tax=Alterisphingorhabdus coralli TaxID=3071408 RepID=A0AA97HZH0_9SPHN|nr:tyrosine-type recombinase/integrase [Parasphingorhabdus sp. SCSIO 66989]WOE74659.1 tyrosine-type recombinase/integrase [Parasphingorhabdus sp. SCSIO 66989]
MKKTLTNKTVLALKPKAKRYDVRDVYLPGFGVRVTPEGRKSFYATYRYGIRQRRQTLGTYPIVTLAEARERALDTFRKVEQGIDPQNVRRSEFMTLSDGVDAFIRQYAKPQNKCWKETNRALKRELVSRFGERDVKQVTRADILEAVDAAVERGSNYQANRLVSYTRRMFNWFVERGIVEASPMIGVKAPRREKPRDRVMSDDELKRVIQACREEPFPFGPYILILMATAQRRSEVANMRWSEINFDNQVWEICAERSKNGKPHNVSLTPFAISILKALPRFIDCDLVFTTTRTTPISGITKMHKRICENSGTTGWRLHDLRRTAATNMAKMKIPPHEIERVLNHVSGTISGVAAVYNRYGYEDEKRDALVKWGEFLEQLEQ